MIARKSFLIVISNFFARFIGWIGLVILAKLWGDFAPEALGIIGFAMSFLALFNIIADLGFSRAHVKRISEGKDLGTCIGTYAAIKIILTIVMVTITFLAILIWKYVFNNEFSDATTESAIIVFVFFNIFGNLATIATVTFEGRKEFAKREIVQMIGSVKTPLMILVALAGVHMAGIAPAVMWPDFLKPLQHFIADHAVGSLAMTYVFAMLATFLLGLWFLRNYPIKRPDKELFKSYFSFALPLMLVSVIGIISLNVDKIMIGFFWSSVEVGYYFTVQQIINIVSILHIAVGTVLFPTFSEYHTSQYIGKLKKTAHLAERYISMVMVPPTILIFVFSVPIINVMLDSAFIPAAPVLIVLSVYIFIYSFGRSYGSVIQGMNRPDILAKMGVLICLSNIILNYFIIPKNGILSHIEIANYIISINGATGAAFATVLSSLIGFVGIRIATIKIIDVKFLQSHTPRHIIAGLIMGGVLYLLAYKTELFPIIRFYHLLLFGGLGLLIYLAVLYILREFKKEDFNFFLDILRPKEMIKYMSSELKEKPPKK